MLSPDPAPGPDFGWISGFISKSFSILFIAIIMTLIIIMVEEALVFPLSVPYLGWLTGLILATPPPPPPPTNLTSLCTNKQAKLTNKWILELASRNWEKNKWICQSNVKFRENYFTIITTLQPACILYIQSIRCFYLYNLCISSILYLLIFDGHSHISSGHWRISRIRGNPRPFVRWRTLWGLLYASSEHPSSVSTTLMSFIALGHLHK